MNLMQMLLNEIVIGPDGRELNPDTMTYEDFHPPKTYKPNSGLTIRSLPALGTQLHIHEGAGGTAQFKHDVGEGSDKYSEINSYDAAMADAAPLSHEAIGRLIKYLKEHGGP